jgi:hypothetical protein
VWRTRRVTQRCTETSHGSRYAVALQSGQTKTPRALAEEDSITRPPAHLLAEEDSITRPPAHLLAEVCKGCCGLYFEAPDRVRRLCCRAFGVGEVADDKAAEGSGVCSAQAGTVPAPAARERLPLLTASRGTRHGTSR